MKIQTLTIDSSECISLLCEIGAACGTDKSPYNTVAHRHPYTGVYSLLLSKYITNPIKFCEIGIAGGASIAMWRYFFQHPNTEIYCFDCDSNFIENVRRMNMPNVLPGFMDVCKEDTISKGFSEAGGDFDVILDDSTHGIDEQVKIIRAGLPFLKSGGMFIIEDIFRDRPHENYDDALKDLLDNFVYASYIFTEHKNRFSPGWNNDKLLVLIKK